MVEVGTGSPLLPPVPQPCCPTCPAFPPHHCQGSSRPPPSRWRDPAASSPRSPTPPTLSGWWWLWPTVGARCSGTRPCRGRTLAPATHPCSVLRSLGLLQEPPITRRRAPIRAAAHRPCLHDTGGGSGHICLLSTQPGRPAGWGGHGVRRTKWPTPLQWAPALTRTLQVRLGGWTPPGPPCGNSPGRTGSSPWLSPSHRVKFLVMGCHGPKAETRWSDPILLRRGTDGTAVPPGSPEPARLGCWHVVLHQPYAITPKPGGGEQSLMSPSHPVPLLSIAPSLSPPCPPCSSSHLLPAGSPSTIDPRPGHRGSDTVVMAALLASLGAALVMAAISTMGYGGYGGAGGRAQGHVHRGTRRTTSPRPHQQRDGVTEMCLRFKKPFFLFLKWGFPIVGQ